MYGLVLHFTKPNHTVTHVDKKVHREHNYVECA